jgi:hypothetical protein
MFHVGQLVVCVDDSPSICRGGLQSVPLERGRIYTVREVCSDFVFFTGKDTGIKVDEVMRATRDGPDHPFGACRFRPVQKTSISIFTAMLSPTKVDA